MTTDSTAPTPAHIDTTRPSIARVYDANINGKDNYEVDRQVVEQLKRVAPEVIDFALDHRAFLIRVTRFIASQTGISQFLDCGSGLPTAENTHQVAQRIRPEARVVYVDNDPSVIAHGEALLAENELTRFVAADIFRPREVLEHPTVRQHLDLSEPVAIFHLGTFHHYDGSPPAAEIMQTYLDAVPSGSYAAIGHFFDPEDDDTPVARRLEEVFLANGLGVGRFRTRREIEALLAGMELVDPGLVRCADWWPDGPRLKPLASAQRCIAGVVARKP